MKNEDYSTSETLLLKSNHVYQLLKVSVDMAVDQLKSCALGTGVSTCSNTNTLRKAKYTSVFRPSNLSPQCIDTLEEGVPTATKQRSQQIYPPHAKLDSI